MKRWIVVTAAMDSILVGEMVHAESAEAAAIEHGQEGIVWVHPIGDPEQFVVSKEVSWSATKKAGEL